MMVMEYRRFGLTQREVSVVGQGTWNLEQDDRAQAINALRTALA
jgi:aryl-alcohol dehydrogenase-like predicted oxidoreductase